MVATKHKRLMTVLSVALVSLSATAFAQETVRGRGFGFSLDVVTLPLAQEEGMVEVSAGLDGAQSARVEQTIITDDIGDGRDIPPINLLGEVEAEEANTVDGALDVKDASGAILASVQAANTERVYTVGNISFGQVEIVRLIGGEHQN